MLILLLLFFNIQNWHVLGLSLLLQGLELHRLGIEGLGISDTWGSWSNCRSFDIQTLISLLE